MGRILEPLPYRVIVSPRLSTSWNAFLDVITDLVVLLLPVPMLVWWNAPLGRTIATGCVFATGSLEETFPLHFPTLPCETNHIQNMLALTFEIRTCIISAVRSSYFVWRMQYTTDLSRAGVVPISLGIAEAQVAVVCGCLMVARPFLSFGSTLPSRLGNNPNRSLCSKSQSGLERQQALTLAVSTAVRGGCRT